MGGSIRHPRHLLLACTALLAGVWAAAAPPAGQASGQERRPRKIEDVQREESRDYFRKWLDEDVVYIISPDERKVFESLSNDEEREQFIEQFWFRRDPDPTTAVNEFKDEHYRRLAYANERFFSGRPGWMTDRGIVYIIHGEPAEIESHKTGESYDRPAHEGGGLTKTLAFEIWRYRYVEGIGTDVEIEFVDPSGSGEFRLARSPWEKDANLFNITSGLTIAEELGLKQRGDHPYFTRSTADRYPGMSFRYKDAPFQAYERLVKIQQAPIVKYKDMAQLVEVDVRYNVLPLQIRSDYFRLNEKQMLVPVTLQLHNRDLSFVPEQDGLHVARVAIYGVVTSMTNRIVAQFEDDLLVSYRSELLTAGLTARSVYQKILTLDANMRYRLDLVVKDLNSETLGVQRQGLILPTIPTDRLAAGSMILSHDLRVLEEVPEPGEMFVLGDIKVRPEMESRFPSRDPVYAYLQLYNAELDQATYEPALAVRYVVSRDGRRVAAFFDERGESVRFSSGQRVVLVKEMPLMNLKPGRYSLEIEVADQISGQKLTTGAEFELTEN